MIDKEVKVYTEHGGGDHFNVTAWEESVTELKLTYHTVEEDPTPPVGFLMSKEEWDALVKSVNFVMGWDL